MTRRYVKIEDIRETRSWRHAPSARLYMYLCMACDWQTGDWHGTRRRTALEVGLTDQEYRTAMANLQRDGLIEITNPSINPETNPKSTQRATQVRVVIIKELGGGTSPTGQPNNQPKEQPSGQPSINKKNKKEKYNLTHARAILPTVRDAVMAYCSLDHAQATAAVRAFCDTCSKRGNTWEDENDFRAHCCDWCLRHYADAKTVTQAANKAEERRERVSQQLTAARQAEEEEKRRRERIEYLKYLDNMETAYNLVKAWWEQGYWYDDRVREITLQTYAGNPGLQEKVIKKLGHDVLDVKIKAIE